MFIRPIRMIFILLFLPVLASAQNEISFVVENGPEFQDANGKVLTLATTGGLNQPQLFVIDINNDGTNDLFVFDRSGKKVTSLIQIATGKYQHQPRYDQIFPKITSWCVFKDYNMDGKPDLWLRDDDNQSVSLFRNTTTSTDNHIQLTLVNQTLRAYNHGSPPLDTSDMYCDAANLPAVEDVDGDGDIDFLTLQKFGSGITLFRNVTADNNLPLDPPVYIEADVCWGDFIEGDATNEIILRRNQFCYKKLKKHAGGSSLLLIDGDEDDDMDLVLGNAGFSNLIYLENGRLDASKQFDTMISYDPKFPSNTRQAKLNTFPAAFYQDVNGDGINDLLVGVNYTDKTSGYFRESGVLLYYTNSGKNNKPVFNFQDSTFLVSDMLDLGSHTAPVFWDMDADGDQDLIIATNGDWGLTADRHDKLVLYENIGTKSKAIFKHAVDDYLGLEKDSIQRLVPTFGDLNKDGKPELLIGEVNGTLILYNIVGSGKTASASKVSDNAFNIDAGSSSAPFIGDVDGDGDNDLLIGCYEGNTFFYKNTSTTTVPEFELVSDTFGGMMANRKIIQVFWNAEKEELYDSLVYFSIGYSSPKLMDLDGNDNPEFILGGEDGTLKIVRDIRSYQTGEAFTAFEYVNYLPQTMTCYNYTVGSNSIAAIADLNDDGKQDIMVGNSRGGIQFMRGSEDCNPLSVTVPQINLTLRVYPNPVDQQLTIQDLPTKSVVQIFDLQGVQHNVCINDQAADVSSLANGIYILRVTAGNAWYTTKFTVIH